MYIAEWFLYGMVTFTMIGVFIHVSTQIVKEALSLIYGGDE